MATKIFSKEHKLQLCNTMDLREGFGVEILKKKNEQKDGTRGWFGVRFKKEEQELWEKTFKFGENMQMCFEGNERLI